ncbi:MAG: hypothetical protein M0Z45_00730 [Actinomycetota bacterium]|nr:hypothetical protein [Actinomycetota bacterium]
MASNSIEVGNYFLNKYAVVDARPRWLPKDAILVSVDSDGQVAQVGANTFFPMKLITDGAIAFRFVAVEVNDGQAIHLTELFETSPVIFTSYMRGRLFESRESISIGLDRNGSVMTPIALDQTNSSFLIGESIFAKYYRKIDPFNREARYYQEMKQSAAVTPYFGKVVDSAGRIESILTGSLKDPKSLFQVTVDAMRAGDWNSVMANIASAGKALGEVHSAISEISADSVGLLDWYVGRCLARGDEFDGEVVGVDLGQTKYFVEVGETLRSLGGNLGNSPSHGDFHLGQCLIEGGRVVVIDFEGEPVGEGLHPFDSTFRDISGGLRSLSYLVGVAIAPEAVVDLFDRVIEMRREFLRGYVSSPTGAELVLSESCMEAVAFFEFEKACYELLYEKTFRPEWIDIPASSVRQVGEALKGRSSWNAVRGAEDRVESIANFYRR